jgi:hypothetical protein
VRATLRCTRALLIVGLVISLVMGCSSNQGPDEIVALIENIVGNCDGTLGKLSEQEKQFASDGNVRGEQRMEGAATRARVIKRKSLSVKRQIDPSGKAGALMSSALADSHVSPPKARAEMQEKLKGIQDARKALEGNVAAAEKCCGLAPNFLAKNLRTLRAQTFQLEVQVEKFMDHQYG